MDDNIGGMMCSKCGNKVDVNHKYCTRCGYITVYNEDIKNCDSGVVCGSTDNDVEFIEQNSDDMINFILDENVVTDINIDKNEDVENVDNDVFSCKQNADINNAFDNREEKKNVEIKKIEFSITSLVMFCLFCFPFYIEYFLQYIGYNFDYGDVIWMLPLLCISPLSKLFTIINIGVSVVAIIELFYVDNKKIRLLFIIVNILLLIFLIIFWIINKDNRIWSVIF